MELVNEAFILIFTYHLYQFTDFMPFLENRKLVSESLVYLTILNILLNIYVAFQENFWNNIHKLKLFYKRWQEIRKYKKSKTDEFLKRCDEQGPDIGKAAKMVFEAGDWKPYIKDLSPFKLHKPVLPN